MERRQKIEWVELYNAMLEDAPPKSKDGRFHAYLFVNEVRVLKSGIQRRRDVIVVSADSKAGLAYEIRAWVDTSGARLLASRIRSNEPGDVPAHEPPRPSLLDGSDAIYDANADEAGAHV